MNETEARDCTENGGIKMIDNKHLATAYVAPSDGE